MVDKVGVTEQQGLAIAAILARRGIGAVAIGEVLAIRMPVGPTWGTGDGVTIVGTGPGTWLAFGQGVGNGWSADLERRLAGLASLSDQTGAYRLFRIAGPDARTLLQRGAAIDMDGGVFPAGSVAVTVIGHVDVIIRNLTDDGLCYEIAVYRSYADSFLRWVDAAIAGL
ncbi:sarcosine oxidase subunit gamma [Niveispirillum sp.]|uniref:sarcosine oxidase subunit gamma n=1 Tax=Niveispirillum sp. TaxID=1917217 RepID=UPI001B6BF196|nr:sarcosine oxidase subunit gamma family protein [Niveispirillum sp.]MBP7336567.1 hypothetical protein [Niveispirillum sp.]